MNTLQLDAMDLIKISLDLFSHYGDVVFSKLKLANVFSYLYLFARALYIIKYRFTNIMAVREAAP